MFRVMLLPFNISVCKNMLFFSLYCEIVDFFLKYLLVMFFSIFAKELYLKPSNI